jgi:NitT/TauT family transport system permease protein
MTHERILAYVLPLLVAMAVLAVWQLAVPATDEWRFVLPRPSEIIAAAVTERESLLAATWVTLRVTVMAFLIALFLGTALAVVFAQSEWIARAFFPYAITLQVTPIVAIAPLILVWVGLDNAERGVLILAVIVAFFPILANTTFGLRSADRQLHELFDLYRASRLQRLWRLQFPAALPFVLAGMKISGGLALIGAVVAEFAAGSGTATGLAWTIHEASFNLRVAKAFAALAMLAIVGMTIYAALSLLEWQLLKRWHESARPKE